MQNKQKNPATNSYWAVWLGKSRIVKNRSHSFPGSSYQPAWTSLELVTFRIWMPSSGYLCCSTGGLWYTYLHHSCSRDASTWSWQSTNKSISRNRNRFHRLWRTAMLSTPQLICLQGVSCAAFCPSVFTGLLSEQHGALSQQLCPFSL